MRKIIFGCLSGVFLLAGCSISPNLSIQQMLERAKFETYTFSANPPWTTQSQITDVSILGGHTFISAYRADDGRHVVLAQSETYRKKLTPKVRKGHLIYTSPKGVKVWICGPKKSYSGSLLESARHFIKDPPAADRTGYALQSPTGAILVLAVNGPLANKELHSLIDSLIPTTECSKSDCYGLKECSEATLRVVANFW